MDNQDPVPARDPRTLPAPQNEPRLASAVDAIVDSFAHFGLINHLDGSNLPTREEVERLTSDLLSLVFPGFVGRQDLDGLTSRYYVGELCARNLRTVQALAGRALSLESSQIPDRDGAIREHRAHTLAFGLLEAIPGIREGVDADVRAVLAGDPAARSAAEVIGSYPGVMAIAVHRLAHHLHVGGLPMIPRMMSELVHGRTGIDIHPGAQIGRSFFIDHGTGVVIGETCVIGDRVKLYQGVTLGALSVGDTANCDRGKRRHPTLEDSVTVYAGATILGGDTVIGRGSTIGGNVWLTQSVPEGTTVMLDKPSLRFVGPRPSDP